MIKKYFISFLISLLFGSTIVAQSLESGKVYRFNNVGKPANYLALSGSTQGAVGATSNPNDLKQQWYVTSNADGTGYYFRNVSNGAYLQSPKKIYVQWPVVFTSQPDDSNMLFTVTQYEGNYVIKAKSQTDAYAFAHNDGSNNIVCWLSSSSPTQWTFQEVAMTDSEIADMLKRFSNTGDEIAKAAFYESHLDGLFTDKSYSELKVTGDLSSNADYLALSPALKAMVDKINSGDWKESNGDWDNDHAKKYRVQLYEPYSEGSAAAGMAGIQAYTNMNNPTGIIANAGDMLYVMVESDVPEGATLYIGGVPDCSMYNNVTAGSPLKKGLNMIMCNADLTHYFIYYTVNTVQNKMPVRSLKNYEPIKIHIEGGGINGFFNYVGDKLYKADTKEDFAYTVARAKHPMFDLLGKYVILHFFLEDTPDLPGGTPQICVKNAFNREKNSSLKHDDPVLTMKAWDDMCFAERILMGIQSDEDISNSFNQGMYESIVNDGYQKGDYIGYPTFQYSDYFNNKMMGITLQAAGLYMNATTWRTAYAPGTVSAILSQFPEDGIWGPAHEYGHMNQTPMRIAGTTEESNNVFSNVANYFVCKTTSRCDYPGNQLKNFNAGNTYLDNGTWGTTRMFWQLWCYYHACGHNKKFYPRLYELLRKYPLKRDLTSIPGKLNPKTDLLHFAKMCCLAAGEDLTNFFISWGFFVPQDNYHIDDYDVYDCILTQEDIDEVKNEIKSWGFEKNDAIILIDDRPGSNLPAGFGYNKEQCGEYGGLDAFKQNSKASGDFSFTVDGNNVTVSGDGTPGVGFLIYDEEGNLIGFSNSDSFTLSNEAAQALVDGKATVKAVGADNETVEVTDPVREGTPETKKELLKTLIDRCDELLALADETLSHVGQLIPSYCSGLRSLREESYKLWEDSYDTDLLTDQYLKLSKQYYSLLNLEEARIKIEPGASYRLINHNYTSRALDAGAENLVSTTFNPSTEAVPFSQQWVLEAVGTGDLSNFYIKNLGDGRYISTTKKQSAVVPLSSIPQEYTAVKIENGIYAFAPNNELKFGLHIDASNKVVQWNTTSLPTQWTLVKVCSAKQIELRAALAEKINEAESLLATCGQTERTLPKEYVFPDECMYSNAKYTSSSNADSFKSWSVLFDKNVATYFHSNYDNNKDSEDGLDHYIRMQAPDNGTFRFFNLSYTTRAVDNIATNPKAIIIEASPDNKTWRDVYHATGLKTGNAVVNETGEICVPEDTKYIRFMVTGGSYSAKGHPYFVLSELSVYDLGEPVFTPDDGFPFLTPQEMQTLFDDIVNAKLDLAYSSTSEQALTERINQVEGAMNVIKESMVPAVDVTDVRFPVEQIVTKKGAEDLTVTLTVEPENATFPQFDWNIADEKIASLVEIDGKSAIIKPLESGVTELSVKVVGNPLVGATAILKVLPEIPVETIVLSPSELRVPVNSGIFRMSAAVYPDNATIQSLKWKSSDPSIVEIDEETGDVTLLRQGQAEITVSSTDGTDVTAKCVVTVVNPVVEGLIIYPGDAIMEEGDELQLNATYIPEEAEQPVMTWKSGNADIATVDPSGMVKALKTGSTTVTVETDVNGKIISASTSITVIPVTLKSITVSPINVTLAKGEKTEISVMLSPEDIDEELTWSIADENIVFLAAGPSTLSREITALNTGMTLLTVASVSHPEIYATCNITVPETPVSEIKLNISDTFFDFANGPQIINATVYPAEAPTPRLVWNSSNEAVATVEAVSPLEAVLTPVANGVTTVTVQHGDKPEISDSMVVEITGASSLANLFEDKTAKVDVFEISGQVVKKNVDLRKLNDLKPGIYILKQGDISKEILVK